MRFEYTDSKYGSVKDPIYIYTFDATTKTWTMVKTERWMDDRPGDVRVAESWILKKDEIDASNVKVIENPVEEIEPVTPEKVNESQEYIEPTGSSSSGSSPHATGSSSSGSSPHATGRGGGGANSHFILQ